VTRYVAGRQAAEYDMEKRFFRVYPLYVAVAACAVAAFLFVFKEISPCNLFVTLIIYYNIMALNYPTEENKFPAGSFFAVWKTEWR